MKKPLKVLSTTAFTAALLGSSLIPVAAAENNETASINQVIFQKDGQTLAISLDNYNLALDAGVIKGSDVKHIKSSNDKVYTLAEYENALDASDSLASALELLNKEGTPQDVTAVTVVPNENGELVPEVPATEELVVESVSAISTTAVDVTIDAPKEDILGATVVVKDSKGNTVEVNPVDISAGDKVASFNFKTAVKADDLVGVWTVEGKEFNLDAVNQLEEIMEAANATAFSEVKLYNALTAAGIKNVDDNRVAAYRTAIVDASPETLADVQKAVDVANEKAGETADKVAALKAVKDANNQIQLLAALEANFDRVNADWIADYASGSAVSSSEKAGIKIEPAGTDNKIYPAADGVAGATYEDVQQAIDAVNLVKLTKAVNDAAGTLDSKKVSDARALVTAYAIDAKEGELGQKEATLDALKFEDALIAVDKATTNNSLKKALTDLDALEDAYIEKYKGTAFAKSKKFEMDKVRDNLLAEYRAEIAKTAVDLKNGRGDLNKIIDDVNKAADQKLLNAVKDPNNTSESLLKALKAYPGVKQVADINKDFYFATSNANFSGVTNLATIQKAVDTANVNSIKHSSTDATNIIAKLNVFGLDNIEPANAVAYANAKATIGGITPDVNGINENTVALVKAQVTIVNQAQGVDSAVTEINKAKTATEVKTALDKLGITSYVNVPTADKLHIAEQVLKVRDNLTAGRDELLANGTAKETGVAVVADAKTFKNVTDLTGHLDKATTGIVPVYNTLVTQFSAANLANKDISVAIAQLDKLKYPTFDNLSAGEKAKVAEIITSNYPVDGEGDPVNYKTLSAVKKAVDEAINAPAPASAK